jgi:regulator of sirC expression with transglutaminase-like and TPR domain
VRLLTQAMHEGAPSTSLLATRADSLLHLGRPSAAIADCSAALGINPDSTKALRARGIARGVVGDWTAAKSDLSAAQVRSGTNHTMDRLP